MGRSMALQPTTLLARRYRLDELVAVGGMGEVWRGHDSVLDRPVAVKVLREEYAEDPQFRDRLRAEARHAAALSHPNVAHVYDLDDNAAQAPPFLVLEFVEGEPLSQLLVRHPRLSAAQTWSVLGQIAGALSAAHTSLVVHRDVKPANVLVRADGLVKVTDFGIARALGDLAATQTAVTFATVHYASPEVVAGDAATPASDLYALGVLAYECLAGRRPFTGHVAAVLAAHREQAAPALPDSVPAPLRELVSALLAKDPRQRPSARSVAARAAEHTGPDGPLPALAGLAVPASAQSVQTPSPATSALAAPTPRHEPGDAARRAGRWAAGWRPRSRTAVTAAAAAAVTVAGTAVAMAAARPQADDHASTPAAHAAVHAPHRVTPARPAPVAHPAHSVVPTRLTWARVGSIALFHPGGSGDDHPEQVPLAVDGNPATAWYTQHYASASFGNLRPGVGLLLDLQRATSVQAVGLRLATPGVDLRVYASDSPDTLLAGRPVAAAASAPATLDLTVNRPVTARYLLVWFTRLAPSDGGYRAGVSDIVVREQQT